MEKQLIEKQIAEGNNIQELANLNNTTHPNMRYWMNKFNLKTQKAINKANGNKKCLTCKEIKPFKDYYKKNNKYVPHCKICYQKKYTDKSKKNKQKSVDYLGGKCSICGYNKCNAALEFHHMDSTEKDHSVAHLMKRTNFNTIKSELDKCVLYVQIVIENTTHQIPNILLVFRLVSFM